MAIRDNLLDRIAEAEKEGWLGEVEGLKVSLAGAVQKLAQLDERNRKGTTVNLGMPTFRDIASRTVTAAKGNEIACPPSPTVEEWNALCDLADPLTVRNDSQ